MTLVVSDPSPHGSRRRTRSVLVVDDDPDIQLVLQVALEDAGYRALPAPTGEAGLLIAHEAEPDAAPVGACSSMCDLGTDLHRATPPCRTRHRQRPVGRPERTAARGVGVPGPR